MQKGEAMRVTYAPRPAWCALPVAVLLVGMTVVVARVLLTPQVATAVAAPTTAPSEPEHLPPPFLGGAGSYPIYRIPSLVVTGRGTLLAFAEGRASRKDQSENDIVLRRSTD